MPSLVTHHLSFLRQGLSVTLKLTDWLGGLSSNSRHHLSLPPSAGIADLSCSDFFFLFKYFHLFFESFMPSVF